MSAALTIGMVARKAGVGVETIRFYQREGLVVEPAKPAIGFRHYPVETIERLRFISHAKGLGFKLAEIATLLELSASDCTTTRVLTQQKLDAVRAKISSLQAMEAALDELVSTCESRAPSDACPIIAALKEMP